MGKRHNFLELVSCARSLMVTGLPSRLQRVLSQQAWRSRCANLRGPIEWNLAVPRLGIC